MLCSKAFPEDSTRLIIQSWQPSRRWRWLMHWKRERQRQSQTCSSMWVTISIGVESTQLLDIGIVELTIFRNSISESTDSPVSRSRVDAACDSWIQLPCENLRTAAHRWTRFILSQRTSSLRSSSVCILDQVPPYATIAIRGYGRDYSSMSLLCRCWQEALAQRLGQSRLRRSALKGNWKTAGDNGSFGMHNSGKKKDKQQNDYRRWKCRVVLSRLPAVSLICSALLGLSLPFQDSNSTRAGASGSNLNWRSSKYERSNADDDN